MQKLALLVMLFCLMPLRDLASQSPTPSDLQEHSHQSDAQRKRKQLQTEPSFEGAQASPLWVKISNPQIEQPPTQSDTQKAEEQATNHWWIDPNWWVAGFTLLLAFIAIGQVILFGIQLWIMNGSLSDSKTAALAAKDAAEAARMAADSAMAGQRAFVSTIPYYANYSSSSPNANFGVKLENIGNLPTAKLRNFIDYRLVDGELPIDFSFPDDAEPITSGTLLFPKGWVYGPQIPKASYISRSDLTAIGQGIKNLYFFGWVKYLDGFSDTPERITKFCYKLRVTGDTQQPFVFIPHDRHNCADDGCKEDR